MGNTGESCQPCLEKDFSILGMKTSFSRVDVMSLTFLSAYKNFDDCMDYCHLEIQDVVVVVVVVLYSSWDGWSQNNT